MNISNFQFRVKQFLEGFPQLAQESQKIYKWMIVRFWHWLEQRSYTDIDEKLILQWLKERSQKINPCGLAFESGVLLKFFDYLKTEGLRQDNPFRDLLAHYPLRGWRGIARTFGPTSKEKLDSLKKITPFEGPLGIYFRRFIQWKQSLGKKYESECGVLYCFETWLNKRKVLTLEEISPKIIREWLLRVNNKNPHTLKMRINLFIQFFSFLTLHQYTSHNPALILKFKSKRRTKPPTILSQDQVWLILEKARALKDSHLFPYRAQIYRILFLTLYALGLRVSEALHLKLKDIRWEDHTIIISKTKFFKSRLLPLGDKFSAALKTYISEHPLLRSGNPDSYLFPNISGKPLSRTQTGRIFRKIRDTLQFPTLPGHRAACLHSFRHSFAVHRLLRWYKEGVDVEQKLLLLSAYLGHKDITSTQVYLKMTWELLESAQERFYMSFGKSFEGGDYENQS